MVVSGKKVAVREINQEIYQRLLGDGYNKIMARIYAGRNTLPPEYLDKSILRKETLQGAVLAGEIIAKHIIAGNTIAGLLDYDIDGISSGAIIYRAIRGFGGKIKVYCPDREREGYGANCRMVHEAANDGCSLALTVDNGVVAYEAIKEAKRIGLDVVVTDHHHPSKDFVLPIADVIVNPWAERGENQFKSKNLCGAGVAWYVMACTKDYLDKYGWKHNFAMKSVVDLLATATVGDLVSIDENNLKLIRHGLNKYNSGEAIAGLQALLDVSGKNEALVNTQTIGFSIGPMINSCGRLGSADRAIRLLGTDDDEEAFSLASELKSVNEERKQVQKQMSEIAVDNLAMDVGTHSVAIYNPEFKEGVIGLVASKVKDLTNLPTGVFTLNEKGRIKGSFRSVPGVHIRDVLDVINVRRPDIDLCGGGHAMAAGASLLPEKWEAFKTTFNEAVMELAAADAFNPTLLVDGELTESDITMQLADDISAEIWGQGMPSPVFAGPVEITDQKILKDAHCKFTGKIGRLMVQGIFFGRNYMLPQHCHAVYTLDINVWNGNRSIQMMVQGIDESDAGLFQ